MELGIFKAASGQGEAVSAERSFVDPTKQTAPQGDATFGGELIATIEHYFLQDTVAPSEGPMAVEVVRREFLTWAEANPEAPMEFSDVNGGLYLRLDVTSAQGKAAITPS